MPYPAPLSNHQGSSDSVVLFALFSRLPYALCDPSPFCAWHPKRLPICRFCRIQNDSKHVSEDLDAALACPRLGRKQQWQLMWLCHCKLVSVGGSKTSDGHFFKNLATWIWNENLLNQNPAEKTSKNKTFEPLNILEVAPVKCTVPCLGFRLWFRHFGHRRSAGGLFGIGLCLCQHRLSARDRTGQDNVR